jgi:hypothetical protein
MSYRALWEFASCREHHDNKTGCASMSVLVLYWDRGPHLARHDWHDFPHSPPHPECVLPYLGIPRLAKELVCGLGDIAALLTGRA